MPFRKALAALSLVANLGVSGGINEGWKLSPMYVASNPSPITHVVIIIQENRSTNELFQFLPGITGNASSCTDYQGHTHALKEHWLDTYPPGPGHTHQNFLQVAYSAYQTYYQTHNNTYGNSSNLGSEDNHGWQNGNVCDYAGQADSGDGLADGVAPYYTLAETWAFADHFFQTNQGPSAPAHQYLISGSSACDGAGSSLNGATIPQCTVGSGWDFSDNAAYDNGDNGQTGCDGVPNSGPSAAVVPIVNPADTTDVTRSAFYCVNRNSIGQLLENGGFTWKQYQSGVGAGYWDSFDAIQNLWCQTSSSTPIASPSCGSAQAGYLSHIRIPGNNQAVDDLFISDLGTGSCNLPSVTYITPADSYSDHASSHAGQNVGGDNPNNELGPTYVTRLVNAIGNSQCWGSTAIFITWDDWGGWFDPVAPTIATTNRYGYRVPLIAISPYVKAQYITHSTYTFGSILLYVEENFGLGNMGYEDSTANDFTNDIFNYLQSPLPYTGVQPPPATGHGYYFPHSHRPRYVNADRSTDAMPDNDNDGSVAISPHNCGTATCLHRTRRFLREP